MTRSIFTALASVDLIVAVDSVDGILTTAALLRFVGNPAEIEVAFTNSLCVDKLPVSTWSGRRVAFVNLAVNILNPQMTQTFVEDLRAGNNEIVAIVDEHNRENWFKALGNFDGLVIEPQSQNAGEGGPESSGEVLRRALEQTGYDIDYHTLALLYDADASAHQDFSTTFGGPVHFCTQFDFGNYDRRVYLARHFLTNLKTNIVIEGWISQYREIVVNHGIILDEAVSVCVGVVRVSTFGRTIDLSTLVEKLYRRSVRVVIVEREVGISFMTCSEDFDLLSCIEEMVPTASGSTRNVTVAPVDEAAALKAVKAKFLSEKFAEFFRFVGRSDAPFVQQVYTLTGHGDEFDVLLERTNLVVDEYARLLYDQILDLI